MQVARFRPVLVFFFFFFKLIEGVGARTRHFRFFRKLTFPDRNIVNGTNSFFSPQKIRLFRRSNCNKKLFFYGLKYNKKKILNCSRKHVQKVEPPRSCTDALFFSQNRPGRVETQVSNVSNANREATFQKVYCSGSRVHN